MVCSHGWRQVAMLRRSPLAGKTPKLMASRRGDRLPCCATPSVQRTAVPTTALMRNQSPALSMVEKRVLRSAILAAASSKNRAEGPVSSFLECRSNRGKLMRQRETPSRSRPGSTAMNFALYIFQLAFQLRLHVEAITDLLAGVTHRRVIPPPETAASI